jgi:hypothetical protein
MESETDVTDASEQPFVHTPGPWNLKVAGVFLSVESPDKFNPIVLWPGFDNCDRPAQENLANARLIAAAPALSIGSNRMEGQHATTGQIFTS